MINLPENQYSVISISNLTAQTFILRFSRNGMNFKPGQHIIVGPGSEMDQREYSIYSGLDDDYLEILVKEVKNGNISSKLGQCRPGDLLNVNGPFGSFGIEDFNIKSRKHVFIATGTGISPFHSMVKSFPGIDYTLIHGVRSGAEAYESNAYEKGRYFLCTSKEKTGFFKGRVTGFLSGFRIKTEMLFYLCGNGNMIYEVYHILRDKGVPSENILSEVYF